MQSSGEVLIFHQPTNSLKWPGGKTLTVIYHRFGITNHRFLPESGNIMIRKPSPLSSRMLRELQQANSDIHQCQMGYDVAPIHGSKSFHMKAMTSQKQLLQRMPPHPGSAQIFNQPRRPKNLSGVCGQKMRGVFFSGWVVKQHLILRHLPSLGGRTWNQEMDPDLSHLSQIGVDVANGEVVLFRTCKLTGCRRSGCCPNLPRFSESVSNDRISNHPTWKHKHKTAILKFPMLFDRHMLLKKRSSWKRLTNLYSLPSTTCFLGGIQRLINKSFSHRQFSIRTTTCFADHQMLLALRIVYPQYNLLFGAMKQKNHHQILTSLYPDYHVFGGFGKPCHQILPIL